MKVKMTETLVAFVDRGGARLAIMIPSRQRPKVVQQNPLFPYANVVVHQSEKQAYQDEFEKAKAFPAALLTHNVSGVPAIRNVMTDLAQPARPHAVIQADDDFRYLQHTFSRKVIRLREAEPIIEVLVHETVCAMDVPTGLFMFLTSPRPSERVAMEPFRLRTWGRADCFGLLDPDLRFDEHLSDCEDMDISLQCISKYGVLWMDCRYMVLCESVRGGESVGGSAGVSNAATVEKSYVYLGKKWGEAVVQAGGRTLKRGTGHDFRVNIPQSCDDVRLAKRP